MEIRGFRGLGFSVNSGVRGLGVLGAQSPGEGLQGIYRLCFI